MLLANYQQLAEKEITKTLEEFFEKQKIYLKIAPELLHIVVLFRKSVFGGKMLRGMLVIIGHELTGSQPTPEIFIPAAAFELLHTALLIHDDVIDQNPMRRGNPTIHTVLGGHYGLSQAISCGILGYFLSVNLLTKSDFPEFLKNKAVERFSQAGLLTAYGELLDVELPHLTSKATEQNILAIHTLKTANYSLSAPLAVGAILGNGSQTLIATLEELGIYLGIAFQIRDDILGIFGLEETTGKSSLSDIREGKNTLLYTYALEHGTSKEFEVLKTYYGNTKTQEDGLKKVQKIFKDSGALVYSEKEIVKYTERARRLIPEITDKKDTQNLLNELIDMLLSREK